MPFDTVLNLAWLLLGVFALASTVRAKSGGSAAKPCRAKWLHLVGVALILAALFPYISATDDILRIEHFNAQHPRDHRHQPNKRSQNDELMRLYETVDTPLLCKTCALALVLCILSLVFIATPRAIDRIAPLQAGRSPPSLLAV